MIQIERLIETKNSKALYEEAKKYTVGGVQGRGKSYPPWPLYVKRAHGARIWDVDDNEFIDYWCGAGPIILGHGHSEVNEAVFRTVQEFGSNYCQPHPREVELAKRLSELIPCAEKTAFCNAGSDAIFHIVRLVRAYTGRPKIIKFEGGLHGWSDTGAMSVFPRREDAGPDDHPNTVPETPGLLPDVVKNTIVLPYNNASVVEDTIKREKGKVAAVLVEPAIVSCNIQPKEGYLQALRQICDAYSVILVFDEVVTGFRHCLGGAQSIFGVTPDIAAFGKAIANGWVLGAVCGKAKYMASLTPEGPVLYSGTFNGSIANVAASLKTIEILGRPGFYERLNKLGNMLVNGINNAIQTLGVRARCDGFYGSYWCLNFSGRINENYRDIIDVALGGGSDKDRAYRTWLLNHGIFILHQKVNRGYLNGAHSEEDIERTIDVTKEFLTEFQAELR
jgi:glutamate-1-semialdehyde 2,1-aminomutase